MPDSIAATPTPNSGLGRLHHDVGEFIFDLAIGGTDIAQPFAGKLQRILAIYKDELERRQRGDGGSSQHLETVTVANLVGLLLMRHHLEERVARKQAGLKRTRYERRISRFLMSALNDFDFAREDMYTRLPPTRVLSRLAEKIWFNFYEVTADDCRRDADAIRQMLATNQ